MIIVAALPGTQRATAHKYITTSAHTQKTVLPDQSAGQGDCASLRSGGIFKYLTQVVFPRFTADISRMLFFLNFLCGGTVVPVLCFRGAMALRSTD